MTIEDLVDPMKFVTVRDLRTRPGEVWKALAKSDLVVTSNGKPIAILSPTSEESLEQSLTTIRRMRAVLAVNQLQRTAQQKESRLSAKAVAREIRAVRRQRANSE